MLSLSKHARIYLTLAFATGLPYWACFTYFTIAPPSPQDSDGAGFAALFAMLFAVLTGIPLTLIGTHKASRERAIAWPNYLALFLGANIPAIATGCMYPVLTMIPALLQLHEPAFEITMAVGTLCIYSIIAIFAGLILPCRRPQPIRRAA